MSNTIPNIVLQPDTITDIYADSGVVAAGVLVGDQINIVILGQGRARLFSGAVAPAEINDVTGYEELEAGENATNQSGDLGAFIYSRLGCTINVGAL